MILIELYNTDHITYYIKSNIPDVYAAIVLVPKVCI